MKKFILMSVIVSLLFSSMLFAAGSVTSKKDKHGNKVNTYTMSWTGDVSSGLVPQTASPVFNGWIFMVVTNPGSAPTDNYDITLTDAAGVDIVDGNLANRDAANTEQVAPNITGGRRFVSGGITLLVTGTTAAGATGDIIIYVEEDK